MTMMMGSFKHAFPRVANSGDLSALCVPCQALAATPIDKISLRAGNLFIPGKGGRECPGVSFSFLPQAGTTSKRVALLKT